MSHGSPPVAQWPERPAAEQQERTAPRPSRRRRRLALALVMPLVLLVTSCASDAPQTTLEPKGPIARSIDSLWDGVFIVAVVVFIIVEFGTLALVIRFRRRKDDNDDDLPAQTHGNTKLEIAWTIVPAVMLAVVGFFTLRTLFEINDFDDEALTVQVTGQQWWWEYSYDTDGDGEFTDEDVVTANDLVVPAGVDVNLDIGSNDVIHSFWIPALNGKKDAVPGRIHELAINADEPGTVRRPVHRVLRPVARLHAPAGHRPDARRVRRLAGQPERRRPDAQRGRGCGRRRAVHHAVLGLPPRPRHQRRRVRGGRQRRGAAGLGQRPRPHALHQPRGLRRRHLRPLARRRRRQHPRGRRDRRRGRAQPRRPRGLAAEPAGREADGRARRPEQGDAPVRGMPNFNLQEAQIDQLVAFLATLD